MASAKVTEVRHARTLALAARGGMGGSGRSVAYFFALDGEGRIAWPFRYVWLEDGTMQPQRWRFGQWVYNTQLMGFVSGRDDLYCEATSDEVAAWVDRQGRGWPVLGTARAN